MNFMRLIKLIWDFRGPNAKPTAEHHAKHLNEFLKVEKLKNSFSAVEMVMENHHTAFLVVEEDMMNELRERLKPNRGQLYNPEI